MELLAMLSADPLDILFENRNKQYGAYPLRKYYARRMYFSMGCTFFLSVLVALSIFYLSSGSEVILPPDLPDLRLSHFVSLDPPIKPQPPTVNRQPPTKRIVTIAFTPPVITPDNQVAKTMASVDQLQHAAIGPVTVAGPPDNGEPSTNGSGTATAVSHASDSVESNKVFETAEIMPEFPGGMEALKRFLQRNLHMPENDLELGTRVRVMARFIVDADGKVRDIEISEPAGEPFNKEVRRVISRMPDWKPGIQNHRHVSVFFNLPVNFINAE